MHTLRFSKRSQPKMFLVLVLVSTLFPFAKSEVLLNCADVQSSSFCGCPRNSSSDCNNGMCGYIMYCPYMKYHLFNFTLTHHKVYDYVSERQVNRLNINCAGKQNKTYNFSKLHGIVKAGVYIEMLYFVDCPLLDVINSRLINQLGSTNIYAVSFTTTWDHEVSDSSTVYFNKISEKTGVSENFGNVRVVMWYIKKFTVSDLLPFNVTHYTRDFYEKVKVLKCDHNVYQLFDENDYSGKTVFFLDLTSLGLNIMFENFLCCFHSTVSLNLSGNAFASLPHGLLERDSELVEFIMDDNTSPTFILPRRFFDNQRNLRTISLTGCKLRDISLPGDVFTNCSALKTLNLSRNDIEAFDNNVFSDLTNLAVLDLSRNKIRALSSGVLSHNNNLKELIIRGNHLGILHRNIFSNQSALEFLDISNNRIEYICGEQFYQLSSLKKLDLSFNKLKTLLLYSESNENSYSVLYGCKNLVDLNVASNNLEEIYDDWRLELTKLKKVNLSRNIFSSIEARSLNFHSKEQVFIDFSFNQIKLVDLSGLISKKFQNGLDLGVYTTDRKNSSIPLIALQFSGNPFECNCDLLPFIKWLTDPQNKFPNYEILDTDTLECSIRRSEGNSLLKNINSSTKICYEGQNESIIRCPKGCSCFYRDISKASFINCKNSNLRSIPKYLPLVQKANHTVLDLRGNLIQNFILPNDEGYKNVTHFILSNNRLESLDLQGASKNIKVLEMSHNKFARLSEETVKFLDKAKELRRVTMHSNPWICNCDSVHLIKFLKKAYSHNVSGPVICSDNALMSKKDEELLCLDSINKLRTSIVFSVGMILALSVVVLTKLYYTYQNHIHVYCYSSRCRLLRWLVSYPDIDKDRKYDAFITFSTEDDEFVANHLVPFLEEENDPNYKLCIHYRDWIGGEFILTQIENSIRNSKRTIVVLSPSFLASVWGVAEFRIAHTAAMKEGVARVIVVLYQDVGPLEEIHKDLKAYLQTNTYIKWGSPWFWEQLVFAMPHPPEGRNMDCALSCFNSSTERGDSREENQQVLEEVGMALAIQLQSYGIVELATDDSDF